MNCEQVEELLSAYLDNMLVLGETAASAQQLQTQITEHLQGCVRCSNILADYRRNDTLLSEMPRVSPSPELRKRIFTSPEYLELTGTFDTYADKDTLHTPRSPRSPSRPQLVALPGGRRTSSSTAPTAKSPAMRQGPRVAALPPRRRNWGLRIMQVAIVATILLTFGVGGLIGWNIWQQQNTTASTGAITPPAGLPGRAPLSAGMRFVFLRNGMLWSAPADGSSAAQQLTPSNVVVADNPAVSPPLAGRTAGDMLAYIDLQRAYVHIIRSDWQRDTLIQQPLLKAGVQPSAIWDTGTGTAILNSLVWSKDGSTLAFAADPDGTDLTNLYLYSIGTGTVQMVPLPMKGSVAHPAWSPDGVRVAFEVTSNGVESVLDYNTQNRGLLIISNNVASSANPNDTVQTLDWSPDAYEPAITWSVGQMGHIHSIWLRHVGIGGTPTSQVIATGNYTQAVYSRNGHGGAGSWLLITTPVGQSANLWRVDVTPGAVPVVLTGGKQADVAQWSPDGMHIEYLESVSSGVGMLHIINATTGTDTPVASGVAIEPLPAWSANGQSLVYNTGTQIVVVSIAGIQTGQKPFALRLQGPATAFTWSLTSPSQLVVAVGDGQSGIYVVDTQHKTMQQLDQRDMSGTILWTQVPAILFSLTTWIWLEEKKMLKGEKVLLRAIEREDLPRQWSFNNDLEIEILGGGDPPEPQSLARLVADFEESVQKGGRNGANFAIEADGKYIGSCGLFHFDHSAHTCEMGIGIGDRAYWGHGYGRDATQVLLRYAFRIRNLHKVWLTVNGNNERAIHSYQACGFVEEGRLRQHVWSNGHYIDLVYMGLVRDAWEASHPLEA